MSTSGALAGRSVIYGGSFDPPHMGHQMACLSLLESLGADAVWLVPAFVHPFGKAMGAFEHRIAMCRLMAAPFGGRVVVSVAERDVGGQGRTYDLVTALQAAHLERRFALAIGADIMSEMARWHRWEALSAMLPIVVLGRSGYAAKSDTPDLPRIASSTLRAQLAQNQLAPGQMPCSVLGYIQAHKLYTQNQSVNPSDL